jgi:hypothetical protein
LRIISRRAKNRHIVPSDLYAAELAGGGVVEPYQLISGLPFAAPPRQNREIIVAVEVRPASYGIS